MHTVLNNVLDVERIKRIKDLISTDVFVDGRATSVLKSKNNKQLRLDSEVARAAGALVLQSLHEHPLFKLAVQPVLIHPPLFSLYQEGMEYPDHVDVALMGGIRTDVALTLFLNDLETYDGGALVVDTGNGVRSYRLQAGDAIAYPASMIHHVARVTRGERLAAVTWIQSGVRNVAQREILLDLAMAAHNLSDTACGPRLLRSYWNLQRQWAEALPVPLTRSLEP